jgi:pyruvate/2-oxoglutarate/acetoin dehydrogenase E1 component
MVAYGYMAELCRQALLRLAFEEEIFAELFIPTQLAPFQLDPVLDSARRTGRLLTVEEGSLTSGWGAEVVACFPAVLGSQLARNAWLPATCPFLLLPSSNLLFSQMSLISLQLPKR